ncbi:MAG: alkaline phosphatase family protein, partial [Bacilli bacterium]
EDEDSVIFINFRPDRAVQIASILTNENYEQTFEGLPKNLNFVCMMVYDQSVKGQIAFHNSELKNVLGPYVAQRGIKQLRIAETEKFAHVTFFFDGTIRYDGINEPELPGSKRILIPSPKVATYDLQPEMSALKVKEALLQELSKKELDLVILNFANGDMVGHTGVLEAAIKAVETVDSCIKEIYDEVLKQDGVMIITADHGNCEMMQDLEGHIITSHTTFDVEVIITDPNVQLNSGSLCDIAPTILAYLDIEQPVEMTGKSLIK